MFRVHPRDARPAGPRPRRIRAMLALLTVGAAAAATTGIAASAGPAAPAPSSVRPIADAASPVATNRKLLIHHGWDLPTPSTVRKNAALIDSRPFDGITVDLPGLSLETFTGTPHAVSEYTSALAPMPVLANVRHNFVIMRILNTSFDYHDEREWATVAQNAAHLAQAVSATGQFAGIFFDTEYYGSGENPWNYGTSTTPWTYSATAGATPGDTPEEARSIATRRGKQFADAIYGAWPSAVVLTTYGPWVGEVSTASSGFAGTGYNDTAWANELMAAFTVGMVEAAVAAPQGEYVDGGELYQLRTASHYQAAHSWIKAGVAETGSSLVPSALRPSYPLKVTVSFGVYDRDVLSSGWPVMSPAAWQSQLTLALEQSDHFAWSYSEAHDWMGNGWPTTPVPQEYLDATARARAAANP